MAALVQTLPPQTLSMHSRQSSSGSYNPAQNSQPSIRTRYNAQSSTGYRGIPSTGPIAPYAFTSTPPLANTLGLGQNVKSASTSMLPQTQSNPNLQSRPVGLRQHNSTSNNPALGSSVNFEFNTSPTLDLNLMGSSNLASAGTADAAKAQPDRYRRAARRTDSSDSASNRPSGSALPSGSGMAAVGHLYNHPTQPSGSPTLSAHPTYRGAVYTSPTPQSKSTVDDSFVGRSQNADLAARYRRRSVGGMENVGSGQLNDTARSSHAHTGSSESATSAKSGRSSSRPTSTRADSFTQPPTGTTQITMVSKQDVRIVNVPSRQADVIRRNPSPLSRPANLNATQPSQAAPQQPPARPATHHYSHTVSPAAEQLAAVGLKDDKKSKSKLRRAFSFGSAAELRKATAQANLEKNAAALTANKRNSKYEDVMEPEQARIAQKQEAGGLGESIYSGQGHFFTGSTDNLSISSTASSASIMLRKMGKGVKKGTRSLVGLFRPKSVIGVPAADGPVNAASAAQVSMVTVEAEREKVNVNVDPHAHAGGGTGFPKLERNSLDNKLSMDDTTVSSDSRSRRSIVGGDRERAEVLATMKKGILKRTDSNQPSPRLRTMDSTNSGFSLPNIPQMNDSPRSSAPSTPADEPPRSGHRRTDSITIEGNDHDDYFSSMARYASMDSKTGSPMTPQAVMRNISFSPRIQFHDTWPSGEYDRRGEIATCNRLTPLLAQQIKEELNTFKMEMEVHESSKVYTHFF